MLSRSRLLGLLLVALAASLLLVVGVALANGLPPGGTFTDDNGNIHEGNIEAIAAEGITKGCNPPTNDLYCPSSSVNRGQMAAFVRRALSLPSSSTDYFVDDDDSVFEGDINAIAEAGITKGCNPPTSDRYCPDGNITREQMAAFLRRAFEYPAATVDYFVDDDSSIFEGDINAIAKAGVTLGCNPPTNNRYCPSDLVKRDQMASFFSRALGLTPIVPPPPITTTSSTTITSTTTTTVPTAILQEGSGSGSKVVSVNIPDEPAVVEFTYNGTSNFIVWSVDSGFAKIDLLVNEIGAYEGTRPMQWDGLFAGDPVKYFEIDADGNWTYQIRRLSQEPTRTCPTSGSGDSVVVISDFRYSAGIADLRYTGSSNFIIWAYSTDDADLLVNEIGNYTGSKVVQSGHINWDIAAHGGTWSIDC